MKRFLFAAAACALVGTTPTWAGLLDHFAGYSTVQEVGTSGLQSSYSGDSISGLSVTGPTTSAVLPALGPNRVGYPNVGEAPSGGSAFDLGVLGMRVNGVMLELRVASGINPLTGLMHSGVVFGVGDALITVRDSAGISHFAALSAWARDGGGAPRSLNGGFLDDAMNFHTSGGSGGASLEGHLVGFSLDGDVQRTGGTLAFNAGNAPAGLDIRAFAKAGTDLGDASLAHASVNDLGQDWFLQSWSIPLANLSSDADFDVALHMTVSCGNDQIGGEMHVPEPSSAVLSLLGLTGLASLRRSGRMGR